MAPTSTKDCIEFYYRWKKTARGERVRQSCEPPSRRICPGIRKRVFVPAEEPSAIPKGRRDAARGDGDAAPPSQARAPPPQKSKNAAAAPKAKGRKRDAGPPGRKRSRVGASAAEDPIIAPPAGDDDVFEVERILDFKRGKGGVRGRAIHRRGGAPG